MNYEQYCPAFERDGFVIVRQFLAPAELDELRSELDRYIRDVVPGLPDSHAFYEDRSRPDTLKQMQYMTDDPFFASRVREPKWVALATTLLGEEANSQGCEWFNKPAGSSRPLLTPPHQDNYYFNLKPPQALTIWTALDPVDRGNGCLALCRRFASRRPASPCDFTGPGFLARDNRLRPSGRSPGSPDPPPAGRRGRAPLRTHTPGRAQHLYNAQPPRVRYGISWGELPARRSRLPALLGAGEEAAPRQRASGCGLTGVRNNRHVLIPA